MIETSNGDEVKGIGLKAFYIREMKARNKMFKALNDLYNTYWDKIPSPSDVDEDLDALMQAYNEWLD